MIKSTPGTLSAAQFIDSLYRRGQFPSQNELAAIIERETHVLELVEAFEIEGARRAVARGQDPGVWQNFLWSEARVVLDKVKGQK